MSQVSVCTPAGTRVSEYLDGSILVGDHSLIELVAADWRALCEEGPCDEPFYRPEWIAANLSAFAANDTVRLVTVYDGSRLRAVLPLVSDERTFCGLPARVLRSASNVHSCRFDVVTGRDDRSAAVARLWECLKTSPDWDVCCLRDVPAGGAGHELLMLARRDGWPVGQVARASSPVLPMTGVADPLALAPNSHFRQNVRRRLRKASAEWTIELRRSADADPDELAAFYALEDSGWKGRERTAIAASPATRSFYDQVARAAATHGYFALYILRFSGVPVAGHFGLFHRQRYYIPKVAYSEEYASSGPGHLIIEAALRDCIARGITEFDFLGPSMPWKLEWTTRTREHFDCYIFRKGRYGRLLHRAKFDVVEPLARLARRPHVARLRACLHSSFLPNRCYS